ncbi:MAG: M24 family metallopeptidase [Erysipelotrichaceae bacterium]|nr:M24 family metallopeptidase [Erysipelotrichaceae bacterium]
MEKILTLKQRAQLTDEILKERIATVLKSAMEETGIKCWLILSKEYCEDPMFKLLTPAMFLTARRVTILILHHDGEKVQAHSCCQVHDESLEAIYPNIYTDKQKTLYQTLNEFLLSINVDKIGIDVSPSYAYFDGLTKGVHQKLIDNLDPQLTARFVPAEQLGLRYAETRSKRELEIYPHVMRIAEEVIEQAFSSDFIKPGITTTDDVEWFMMERVKEKGMDFWFSPDVNLQNGSSSNPMQNGDIVINKGDLLHCDFGITYLNLNTDTQRLAYVLKDGETEIPAELKQAYDENMKFHQIVMETFEQGKTGNQVLKEALEKGRAAGYKPILYTHPLGYFGHGPGPLIGLFSNQEAVYPAGELKINDDTAYALELNTRKYLEMYKKETFMFTEESVVFIDGRLQYLSKPKGIYKI